MVTFEQVKNDKAIRTYITSADDSLRALGYTEHSFAHVTQVAQRVGEILTVLNYGERMAELGRIAGFMHDIGNLVNRSEHSQSGAVMAFRILDNMGMEPEEIALIVTAIGNHDEGTGVPVNAASAALILADKSDVRRSRVRCADDVKNDIHDRVNYSVVDSAFDLDPAEKTVTLSLTIDTSISSLIDYFDIFMERMTLCRQAAKTLGLEFKLKINGQSFI